LANAIGSKGKEERGKGKKEIRQLSIPVPSEDKAGER